MKSIVALVLALSFALPMATQAGDLCLDAAQPNPPTLSRPVIIGRGFTVPKKNKCKPFIGVMATSIPAQPSAVTGSACASFDGTNVTFTLVATLPPSVNGANFVAGTEVRYSVRMSPQGSSAGTGALSAFLSSGSVSTGPLVAFECHNAYPDNL